MGLKITWVPCPSFTETATILLAHDVSAMAENAYQILRRVTGEIQKDKYRPQVVMWSGSGLYLVKYAKTMLTELRIRGVPDEAQEKQMNDLIRDAVHNQRFTGEDNKPWWLGHEGLMLSHRSALRGHDSYYRTCWPHVVDGLPMAYPRAQTVQKERV